MMDLSLDDIIKKNNVKRGPQKPIGRLQNTPGGRRNKLLQSKNGGITKPPRRPLQSGNTPRRSFTSKNSSVVDARLKIIQKNRQRLIDARDKLSELAKHTDARTRIGGRNLKLAGRRDRKQVVRGGFNRPNFNQAPVVLQRSIRNNITNLRDTSSLIRCTVNRPVSELSVRPTTLYTDDEDMPLPVRPHNDLSSIKVVTHNEYTQYAQEYPSEAEPIYVSHYNQPVFTRQLEPSRGMTQARGSGRRMSQEMRARLDTYSAPQGHRIVVSNLHASVTHEDIKELFEDIGPLVTSRLVRAGTAEVIYKLQKDAKKAVDAYHNRQLDGQPMKCLLVTSHASSPTRGVLRSSNMPATPKFPSSSRSMVMPDLSAIHKALFTSK